APPLRALAHGLPPLRAARGGPLPRRPRPGRRADAGRGRLGGRLRDRPPALAAGTPARAAGAARRAPARLNPVPRAVDTTTSGSPAGGPTPSCPSLGRGRGSGAGKDDPWTATNRTGGRCP